MLNGYVRGSTSVKILIVNIDAILRGYNDCIVIDIDTLVKVFRSSMIARTKTDIFSQEDVSAIIVCLCLSNVSCGLK